MTVRRTGLSTGEHTAQITVDSNAGTERVQLTMVMVPTTGDIIVDVPLRVTCPHLCVHIQS